MSISVAELMKDEVATDRARRAWFRYGSVYQQPGAGSGVCEISGKRYVVLMSGGDTLAVYRVLPDGEHVRSVPVSQLPAELVTYYDESA
jgi:hypothetical protein